jgi:hypothetical protein
VTCRIVVVERDGRWVAHAEDEASGSRFGIECTGATSSEATGRMSAWIDWQREHEAALQALQAAERAYHRALAEAFEQPHGAQTAARNFLDALDRARSRLDSVRLRKPEPEQRS